MTHLNKICPFTMFFKPWIMKSIFEIYFVSHDKLFLKSYKMEQKRIRRKYQK